MANRYAFDDNIEDKNMIGQWIRENYNVHSPNKEYNAVTILITGHGRERYKENFKANKGKYSDPFAYKLSQNDNSVRIFSKAGKPKTCAWDYGLCTPSMSSQDYIKHLASLFFAEENKNVDTLTLMSALSIYFKMMYPKIIDKISNNYRDLPEDKNAYSPNALGYEQRYNDFQKVLKSISEKKHSQLKSLNHQKIFTIRPENPDDYNIKCEKYTFELVDVRINEKDSISHFALDMFRINRNLVPNYFIMDNDSLINYVSDYKAIIYNIHRLNLDDYEKYILKNFVFTIYFGNELTLSEIVETFVILGFETINIIDNTCRVQEKYNPNSSSVNTESIEMQEKLKSRSRKKTNKLTKTRKNT